jgi:uncharacterized membrane protein YgcG
MSSIGLRRQSISSVLSVILVFATIGSETGAMAQSQGTPSTTSNGSSSDYAGQGTPASAEELQSLVAPIALYPDALVAQILDAATFPDQVAVAEYWMQQNKSLTGKALMTAVNGQSWDPSVKALTQFPSVLSNMAQNLSWTSQLGEAYHNQQSEVMSAIQTLRAKAKSAGNLKSGSQITVVQQSPQTIVIQPANPQVVYVPLYNPTVVYGTPYVIPGYSTGDLVATGLLSFGAGMAVGAMMSGGCCGWGYSSWNCDWYHGGAYYHGAPYYGNNAWHGGYNNYGYHPYNNGYNNSGYHSNYNNGYNSSGYHANNANNSGYNRTGQNNYSHNTNVSGNTVNVNSTGAANRAGDAGSGDQHAGSGGWASSDAARGWGSRSDSGGSTAFSGFGSRSGSSSFGGGGWGSRASSSRGWGSRGGGGGWGGGGGFRGGGGGFRR